QDEQEGVPREGRKDRRGEERHEGRQEVTATKESRKEAVMTLGLPNLGHGIGLRREHYAEVIGESPRIDWLEVITENFLVPGGNPRRVLRAARERYPVVLHGVSLSIGGTDPLDEAYLDDVAALADEIEPAWISDHLCWGSAGGVNSHDLLPLPYTRE